MVVQDTTWTNEVQPIVPLLSLVLTHLLHLHLIFSTVPFYSLPLYYPRNRLFAYAIPFEGAAG
jgi:hypothetical protein